MRIRTRTCTATAAVALAATLVLSGCGSSADDTGGTEVEADVDQVTADGTDEGGTDEAGTGASGTDGSDADDSGDGSDGSGGASSDGLSQEAVDSGYTATSMPGGWPDELPLPDGVPVSATRSGESFYLVFDVSSVGAGQEILDWYASSDWSVVDDIESDGIRMMSFASAETNDYGPLRRVTLSLGMTDWPTGFQYHLEVQE